MTGSCLPVAASLLVHLNIRGVDEPLPCTTGNPFLGFELELEWADAVPGQACRIELKYYSSILVSRRWLELRRPGDITSRIFYLCIILRQNQAILNKR